MVMALEELVALDEAGALVAAEWRMVGLVGVAGHLGVSEGLVGAAVGSSWGEAGTACGK